MLPTPSTLHVDVDRIYEPAEDSFLLLDTLSSDSEIHFLTERFADRRTTQTQEASDPSPLILEVGTGSGVVLAFVAAHAKAILGRGDILALGTDVNQFACEASKQTVLQACLEASKSDSSPSACLVATIRADLTGPLRFGVIDLLIFNPPYVPSAAVPELRNNEHKTAARNTESEAGYSEVNEHLLSLSYEGGLDGMEVTNRLLDQIPKVLNNVRGAAYILLCQQNKPEEVMCRIRQWGAGWSVSVVGHSGKKAGWEKLQIIRIWRTSPTSKCN